MKILKNLFLNGLSFILPFVLIIFIVKEGVSYIHVLVVDPIEKFIPKETLMGIEITNLVAFGIFMILVFTCGLFLLTKPGKKLILKIGKIIPGYNLLRSVVHDEDELNDSKLIVCLAKPDESWQYGFIIETHLSGMYTVFVPDAPNFLGGSVFFLKEEQVKKLDISPKQAWRLIMQLGFGSKEIFDNKIKF
ncbi:MAG TPA: hypothetical protein PKD83_08675 [Ignavibacteria bacterium]|nr:hypothetical protein [Ignavibacteria bacterium]